MGALRKIVKGLAVQSDRDLRQTRLKIENSTTDRHTQQVVLDLIDMFIRIGPDMVRRKKAMKSCLKQIDKIENRGTKGKPGGCARMFALAIIGGALLWLLQ